jgi:hypothetical protein
MSILFILSLVIFIIEVMAFLGLSFLTIVLILTSIVDLIVGFMEAIENIKK